MATKTKTRTQMYSLYRGTSPFDLIFSGPAQSEMITYSTSKRNRKGHYTSVLPVTHIKTLTPGNYSGGYSSPGVYQYRWSGYCRLDLLPIPSIISQALASRYIQLDFQKNNDFELLPFLKDWDETLASITGNLLHHLSTDSVRWGYIQLLRDMKAAFASLEDIFFAMQKSYEKILGKPKTTRVPVSFVIIQADTKCRIDGTLLLHGFFSGDVLPDTPLKAMAAFADEIGFHPDLRTLWDIIPRSFVIDYFIPIGDFLESLHPRGWFNPSFDFNGYYTIDVTADLDGYTQKCVGSAGTYSIYIRSLKTSLSVPTRPAIHPEWRMPSVQNLVGAFLAGKRGR